VKDFSDRANFLFVNKTGAENIAITVEPPPQANIKLKALLVIKARPEQKGEPGFPTGVANEIVFMEMTKPILDNLFNTCQVSLPPPSFNKSGTLQGSFPFKFQIFLTFGSRMFSCPF
jgi:hypothetical protein